MLDFNNILATPGADIQYFEAPAQTNLIQWQTWRKPRGAKWIYMWGVGGASGGGCGINTGTSSGGGAGGSSGAQALVMIPAIFVPDLLYIQCGAGGAGATTTGAVGAAGTNTYVAIGPSGGAGLALADTFLRADGAAVGTAAPTASLGGTATNGAATPTIGNMPLAGRGFVTLIGGQAGSQGGGSTAAGTATTLPTTGIMVTAGGGGGGSSATPGIGGEISALGTSLGTQFFQLPILGGTAGTGATAAGAGRVGFKSRNALFNFGGSGGGGASTTVGGIAGNGADGAPGCGGGGGGGANTTNTTIAPGGNGGPGFVYMITI